MISSSIRDKKQEDERQKDRIIEDGSTEELEQQRDRAIDQVVEDKITLKKLQKEAKELNPEFKKAKS